MLTSDLLRVRVHKGVIKPRYLDPEDAAALDKAQQLTALFDAHLGGTRGDIDAAVEAAIGHGTDFLIWRGLAKLLYDRSLFETVAQADPVQIRRAVFEAAAALGPVVDAPGRAAVLQRAAQQLQISPEGCEQGLYADLEEHQRLTEHRRLQPQALLHRYNLALAQAVLYKATQLTITLSEEDPNQLRYLFQSLKFFGLMHRAWRVAGQGYRLEIDGPASLFHMSRKYGVQMAKFLPALVLGQGWSLTASLDWEQDKDRRFELSAQDQLVSHYRARGQWLSDEERMFQERFDALKAKRGISWPWSLERRGTILELDAGEVLVADYVLSYKPMGKRKVQEVCVEVVGFWRRAYLERRIEFMQALQGPPLILVLSEQLKSDRDKLAALPPQVVPYKTVIHVDRVVEAAAQALGVSAQ